MRFGARQSTTMPVLVPALALAASCYGAVEGSFDRNRKVSGPVELSISTGSGAIRIQ